MVSTHFDRLKSTFNSGKTRPLPYRKAQLRSLIRFLNECETDICTALSEDLRKPKFETLTGEIGLTRVEARHMIANLCKWAAPNYAPTPLAQFPAVSTYVYEPKGVVLILGAWNFPLMLTLTPLVAAIAAGNTAILKPSEHAPHSSKLMAEKLPLYMDADCVQVIEGDHEISQELLQLRFDHIFFTGSTRVGRLVMQEAAKNLTPVTLELGGKCPTIVDETAKIKLAATRILWGKLMNAGQSCLAPDFVLVQRAKSQELVAALKEAIANFFNGDPKKSPDFGRIVSATHVARLQGLLQSQNIVFGGETDASTHYIAPTLVLNPKLDSPLMQEEIFGPILPIIEYDTLDDALKIISEKERPLALYVFSSSRANIDRVRTRTISGAMCINDAVSHIAVPDLPFGGIGASGMGNYHGESGFQTFSHKRAYLKKSTLMDFPLRYAPYQEWKARVAGWFLR